MSRLGTIAALAACVLAGAALAVSLLHGGPRGAAGPAGPAGRAASAAQQRYGVCWSAPTFTQTWADGSSDTWVSYIDIASPQLSGGVYQCPQGETFVSIVPVPAGAVLP